MRQKYFCTHQTVLKLGEVSSVFYILEVLTIATSIISKVTRNFNLLNFQNLQETLQNLFAILGKNNEISVASFAKIFSHIQRLDKKLPQATVGQINKLIQSKGYIPTSSNLTPKIRTANVQLSDVSSLFDKKL